MGELLISNQLINEAQLNEALKIQKEKSGLLGQILVSLGYTTEEDIARALTAQYGFPYLPLAGYEIEKDLAKVIPENVARQYGLIAVDRVGSVLTVAMSNPLNTQAIEDIEMITNLKIQIFVATTTDVNEAINSCYK